MKGAFDRANPGIILTELASMTHGTLIRIIRDYLTDRLNCVYFERVYSRWEWMDLGTPQGGVLSPILFSIIMNTIGNIRIRGVTITIYADDIVVMGGK